MYIALKKQVKGGVLLYALLMLAIFSLLVQFYLNRQIASNQLLQTSKQQATAYLMAQVTFDEVKHKEQVQVTEEDKTEPIETSKQNSSEETRPSSSKEKETVSARESLPRPLERKTLQGELSFTAGRTAYTVDKGLIEIRVILDEGHSYRYRFPFSTKQETSP